MHNYCKFHMSPHVICSFPLNIKISVFSCFSLFSEGTPHFCANQNLFTPVSHPHPSHRVFASPLPPFQCSMLSSHDRGVTFSFPPMSFLLFFYLLPSYPLKKISRFSLSLFLPEQLCNNPSLPATIIGLGVTPSRLSMCQPVKVWKMQRGSAKRARIWFVTYLFKNTVEKVLETILFNR